MKPVQKLRKLQERLVKSKSRILLIIYYKKSKLKSQEERKNTIVNANIFTVTTEFSCTLISFNFYKLINNYTFQRSNFYGTALELR